ncbi:MAG: helix-turn-helix transcriptional regulator [Singulisphaera sp.]|nr:helix-turn-helix transcriptional regulator [Singulisphaera sp.]
MPSKPLHPVRQAALAKLGAALREGRARAGLSQPRAAEQLGVSVWTYRSWEHGRREPTADVLRAITRRWQLPAEVLGLAKGSCPCCLRPYP